MKKILLVILLVMTVFLVSGCQKNEKYINSGKLDGITFKEVSETTNYIKIEMASDDLILLELYPNIAPITVANFQQLVSEKFYDGVLFHRVIKDFVIQAGINNNKEAESIEGEFASNGHANTLLHKRGVISMARVNGRPNSASSQFFIMHQDNPSLDGDYAAFGKVIAGLKTVDKIAAVNTDSNDKPLIDQKIKTIRFISISK